MENLSDRLVDKSIEAFIMGLEIYNKPTIRYRIEGFSFFICNAWELMLKSYLIKKVGEQSIYYNDKPDRTINLENAVKLCFTNDKDPLRKNIERIIQLRNTSTHFITEDYEQIYAPLFQACVINYTEKMIEFHSIDITTYIAQNFLTLNVRLDTLTDSELKAKYSNVMAERMIKERNEIALEQQVENSSFSIPVETTFYITKNKENADLFVGIDKNADSKVQILREVKNPNDIYPLATKRLIQLVNKRLKSNNIRIKKIVCGELAEGVFTTADFQLFNSFYDIKSQKHYSFYYELTDRYSYSPKLVDFIFEEIKKDPENIIQNLKSNLKK
ncbi:DUF3644 domain-containing protein [Enterococcus sp. AZ128]|uniref:DUF3644 domain-containing protein n=1 Tax=unclassified Enterococcus TaxID=2608891 RepID=UPI003F686C5A